MLMAKGQGPRQQKKKSKKRAWPGLASPLLCLSWHKKVGKFKENTKDDSDEKKNPRKVRGKYGRLIPIIQT
jgi:hypothetical protein